MQELRW